MNAIENLRDLSDRFTTTGRIDAIVLRPARKEPAIFVDRVEAVPGFGLMGDRRSAKETTSQSARKREISLIQAEHLPLIAKWSGLDRLSPLQLRRNLVVSGINLIAMRSPFPNLSLHWQIGERVRLEVTGSCDPCSRMELELGYGVYNAMRGHGGITARLLVGGTICVGDPVTLVSNN